MTSDDTRRECIRRLMVIIESGRLRRWECWLLRRIRERLIGEGMRFRNLSREDTA